MASMMADQTAARKVPSLDFGEESSFDLDLSPCKGGLDWSSFYLDLEGLNARLVKRKREIGKRNVSRKSMTFETRTFSEILDKEVEKVVLFYLRIQGDIASRVWKQREFQLRVLNGDEMVTMGQIDVMCQSYRVLGNELLELLEYLNVNVSGLRRIIKKHDKQFDLKMGKIYFDNRLSGGSHSPLLQLYHQEGLRAIISTLRNGFEDVHEAKSDILSIQNYSSSSTAILPQQSIPIGGEDADVIDYNYGSIDGSIVGSGLSNSNSNADENESFSSSSYNIFGSSPSRTPAKLRSTYLSRLSASPSMPNLAGLDKLIKDEHRSRDEHRSSIQKGQMKASKSMLSLFQPTEKISPLTRSISNLEPILKRLTATQLKVNRSQNRSTSEYVATHSIMALENKRIRTDDDDSEDSDEQAFTSSKVKVTSQAGLYLNLFVTFLYMANQYVVAPTSGRYAQQLGESKSMQGFIIGLSPFAALFSALVYSYWTNFSFRRPLLVSILFATVGNLIYGMALQCNKSWMLLLGRFLTGLGAPRGIARRYISDHVSLKHRTLASSHFVTAGALGLAFGPFISSMVTITEVDVVFSWNQTVLVHFLDITAPGWIMFLLWFISLLLVWLMFEEPVIESDNDNTDNTDDKFYSPQAPRPPGIFSTFTDYITGNNNNNSRYLDEDYSKVPSLQENVVGIEMGDFLIEHGFHDSGESYGSESSYYNLAPTIETIENSEEGMNIIKDIKDIIKESDDGKGKKSDLHLHSSSEKVKQDGDGDGDGDDGRDHLSEDGEELNTCWVWDYMNFEVTLTLLLYFVNKTGQEMVVSSIPAFSQDIFNWSVEQAGFFMAAMGALVLPTNIFLNSFNDVEDRSLLFTLYYFSIASLFLVLNLSVFDYTPFQYMLGSSLLFTMLSAQEGLMMSVLSTVTSPDMARGTLNSGFLATEVGTMGRVMSDIGLTIVMDNTNGVEMVNTLFLPIFVAILCSMLLLYYYYERFVS